MPLAQVEGEGSSPSGQTAEEDDEEFPEENGFFPQSLLNK